MTEQFVLEQVLRQCRTIDRDKGFRAAWAPGPPGRAGRGTMRFWDASALIPLCLQEQQTGPLKSSLKRTRRLWPGGVRRSNVYRHWHASEERMRVVLQKKSRRKQCYGLS